MKNQIKIEHKKLGRAKADGQAWIDDNKIEIDSRLTGMAHLETLVHEMLHMQNPKWAEIKIQSHARVLATIIWEQKYRRVELK